MDNETFLSDSLFFITINLLPHCFFTPGNADTEIIHQSSQYNNNQNNHSCIILIFNACTYCTALLISLFFARGFLVPFMLKSCSFSFFASLFSSLYYMERKQNENEPCRANWRDCRSLDKINEYRMCTMHTQIHACMLWS